MRRFLCVIVIMMIGWTCTFVNGQELPSSAPRGDHAVPKNNAEFLGRPELLRRIGLYEAAARGAQTTPVSDKSFTKIYVQLGLLYEYAGMYAKSEDAMRRAILNLRRAPQEDSQEELAEEMSGLAQLHVAMGEFRQAEKEHREALRIRQGMGDSMGVALTWRDLASLYSKQRNFKKAADFAGRAMAVLGDDPQVSPTDRIGVRQVLATALCGIRDCARAIPMLQDAVELAKSSFGEDSLAAGLANYMLGYGYWQSGDLNRAAEWMRRGTARMKLDMGGHPIYVGVMTQYAQFLRQSGQMEAAAAAEREVRQADNVVDVRSLAARQGESRSEGLAYSGSTAGVP